MKPYFYRRMLAVFACFALLALAALLSTSPTSARGQPVGPQQHSAALAPTAPPAQQECPSALAYKSCLGLMPPAYGLDPHAPLPQADPDAPEIEFLDPARNVATGSWPQVLAPGIFNSDRRADVVVGTARYFDTTNDERLHLFTAGAEGQFARKQRLPSGAPPEAIVVMDANLDRRHDVVLARASTRTLAVYLQTAVLTGPLMLTLAGPSDALAVGDFSGDLRPDLAAVTLQNSIQIFRSSINGYIDGRVALPYANSGFNALASGDLDNDGDDDLAALRGAGYAQNAALVYLQGRRATFAPALPRTPKTGGYLPHSLAVGDVNSDGRDDLVVTAGGNEPNSFLNVFLQGDRGLSATPSTQRAFHLPSAVAIADISHDGREDVVVVHDGWRTLSIYTQTDQRQLAPYASMTVPYSSRYRPHAMALADFDGNGSLDVALVGQEAGLTLITNTERAPTSAIAWPPEAATLPSGTLVVTGTASDDAVAVEVRLRGRSEWQPTTLRGNTWRTTLVLPEAARPWTIEARAIDDADRVQAPPARRRVQVVHAQYFPIVRVGSAAGSAPDLVGSFRLSPDKRTFAAGEPVQIIATIANRGSAPAPPFWVDLYLNPASVPSAPSTRWDRICGMTPCYGLAWAVIGGLAPGQSVTLTSSVGSYTADQSIWHGYFASGTSDVYLLVDSSNPGVPLGAAAESNETNNRAELHGLQVTGPNPARAPQHPAGELPPRPPLPAVP